MNKLFKTGDIVKVKSDKSPRAYEIIDLGKTGYHMTNVITGDDLGGHELEDMHLISATVEDLLRAYCFHGSFPVDNVDGFLKDYKQFTRLGIQWGNAANFYPEPIIYFTMPDELGQYAELWLGENKISGLARAMFKGIGN